MRYRTTARMTAVALGTATLSLGLVACADGGINLGGDATTGRGLVMARAADSSLWLAGVTFAAAAFVVFTRQNPLIALAAAACAAVIASRAGFIL